MGIRKEYMEFLSKNCDPIKAKMLELGTQDIKDGCCGHHKTGGSYFASIGCYHLTIDTNGRTGAMKIDLGKKITGFNNEFDIITDFGTSICVDNYKMCLENIFRMCRPGGAMIHILPEEGSNWIANYYVSKKYFRDIAKKKDCSIKNIEIIKGLHGNLVAVALIKNESIQ